MSLAALVSHLFGILPMVFFLTYFGVPSLLLIFLLTVWARRVEAALFLNCLAVGLAGGLVGTLLYDGARYLMRTAAIFNYDGFKAIYIFGMWISGQPVDSAAAAVAGWIYHFWNGLSFGVFYTLTFGRRHWLYGVGYGLVMELFMLGLFPMFVQVSDRFDFIALSLIGHMFYGAGLGLVTQRYAKNWRDST
jgi:hypothetical protein